MTPKALVEHLLNEDEDRHQRLMNQAYKRWQKGGDLENVPREDFYGKLEEPHRMAVVFGNLNYQVENGGFDQWFFNGYGEPAWPLLKEYVAKYGSQYPGIGALGKILNELESEYENEGGNYDSIADWVENADNTEELENAINNEDWREVYDQLGGTDLDERRFQIACEETFRNGTSIETYEEGGQWGYRVQYEASHGETVVFFDSGATYSSEEEADGVGSNHEFEYDELEDENVTEMVKDDAKSELIDEYAKHKGQFLKRLLDELGTKYYAINKQVLADLQKIFETEYPDGKIDQALAALKKGWETASTAVKDKVVKPVQRFAQRVGKAGQAAARAFRGEESQKRAKHLADKMLD